MSENRYTVAVNKHDVIQVAPVETVKQPFHGKFALVDEVRNWGVTAHIDTFEGQAHLRLAWGTFAVIGPAEFLPVEDEDQEP